MGRRGDWERGRRGEGEIGGEGDRESERRYWEIWRLYCKGFIIKLYLLYSLLKINYHENSQVSQRA